MASKSRVQNLGDYTTQLAIESLEQRLMLSTVPPTVSDVTVSSSSWDSAFIDYLQTHGLGNDGVSIPVGAAAQSQSLSWLDLDRISITFSEDVDIQSSDLSISGVANISYGVDHFFYDPQLKRATWTLETPFAAEERVQLDLDGDGIDPVQDLDGDVLDGDWTNEISTYNSGNGTAGGDFEFRFNVLEGDTLPNYYVSYFDTYYITPLIGVGTSDPGYSPKFDLNGDGIIESSDRQAVIDRLYSSLPTGTPAGVASDAPTTTGFDLEAISDRVNDTRISLDAVFEDYEDADSAITYSITGQTNRGLFDSVAVDSATGELVLNPASTGSGRNSITVTATDSSGLSVRSTLTADLDYTNQPPVISHFFTAYLGGDVWEVSGTVTDSDEVEEGFIVQLTGLFDARVAVATDGSFYYREIVLGFGDWVDATTSDPHGEVSNTPITYVGL